MAVNAKAWRSFPVADRKQTFNADDAIKRIQQFSAGSVERFNTAFLWRDSNGPPNNKNSYRLPVADVINGRLTLVPHAVTTAAAILQGAHGGLEGVVGEPEKKQLRDVVTQIYKMMRDLYEDERIVPPWLRNDTPPADRPNRQITAALQPRGLLTLPVAASDRFDTSGARRRLWTYSGGDFRRFRDGFLWWDKNIPTTKGSYQLPVADVVDGRLMLMPAAVLRVAEALRVRPSSMQLPDDQFGVVRELVAALSERIAMQEPEQELVASVGPLRPPAEWFTDPLLSGPSRLSVTADGRVQGHLAQWDVCHMGIRDACRMAPRSRTGYRYFMDGTTLTADGTEVPVGRLTVGTGHADIRLGYVPAADHYDNTGCAVAVVAAGEDQYGIWVSGAITPDADEKQVAALRRSPLSGDWRPTPQGLELVAALAVNSPGFPIVGFTASGEVEALVAAGMVLSDDEIGVLGELSKPEQVLLKRLEEFDIRAKKLTEKAKVRRFDTILKRMEGL